MSRQQAAFEVDLAKGGKVWLHGKAKGSLVTFGGKPATEGLYSSADGNMAFTVGKDGKLTAPVTILPIEHDFTRDEEEEFGD